MWCNNTAGADAADVDVVVGGGVVAHAVNNDDAVGYQNYDDEDDDFDWMSNNTPVSYHVKLLALLSELSADNDKITV